MNCLLAGWTRGNAPELHFMDYLATRHRVNSGGHGYGGCFVCRCSINTGCRTCLERRRWLVDKCVLEVTERVGGSVTDLVKIVDKSGVGDDRIRRDDAFEGTRKELSDDDDARGRCDVVKDDTFYET